MTQVGNGDLDRKSLVHGESLAEMLGIRASNGYERVSVGVNEEMQLLLKIRNSLLH